MEQVDANVNLQTNAINLQAMHAARCTLCAVHSAHSAHCALHAAHCTLCTGVHAALYGSSVLSFIDSPMPHTKSARNCWLMPAQLSRIHTDRLV